MEFFRNIANMKLAGDLTIVIKQLPSNELLVSLLLTNLNISDNAKQRIQPLLIRGTPEEIDLEIFNAIQVPLGEKSNGLIQNMESFQTSVAQAAASSKQAKTIATEQQKQQTEKEKAYTALMLKVDDLASVGKYREAYGKLPDPLTYPEKANEINKRKADLQLKFSTGTLFEVN